MGNKETKISRENPWNANHSTENWGNSGRKVKRDRISGQKLSKIWAILARFSFLSRNYVKPDSDAVPLSTGNYRDFRSIGKHLFSRLSERVWGKASQILNNSLNCLKEGIIIVTLCGYQGPFLEGPEQPQQNLKPYDYRAVLFTYSRYEWRLSLYKTFQV